MGLSLIKAHICVAIAVLDIDNHVTDDIYARSVAEELLVCRFCIILLCFKELMVEINIVGFHLIQFTSGNQGFYKQGVELVCRIEILVEVYHIGSTAVKGLAAKSIIDIMPVVTNISLVDKHNKEFVAIGYECMGEFGIEGRRYFRKGGDNRTHQIHIFEQSNHKDINRHIAVRDFLRTHPDIALEYGELKMELAYRFSEDIEGYCTGKDAFVKQLEKDALLWYQNNESYKTR